MKLSFYQKNLQFNHNVFNVINKEIVVDKLTIFAAPFKINGTTFMLW